MSTEYIHYGSDSFDIHKFIFPINERINWCKPIGGLWASPINAPYIGWREWCEGEGFNIDKLNTSFIFTLKDTANVMTIHTDKDLEKIRPYALVDKYFNNEFRSIDFEKIIRDGYDAIEFYICSNKMYYALYGWDVDSLLVLNPNCIAGCSYESIGSDSRTF